MFAQANRHITDGPIRREAEANSSHLDRVAPQTSPRWQSLALRPSAIQRKITLSQPGDPYEQEAERVADRVMRTAAPHPPISAFPVSDYASGQAQRKCATCEEEEEPQVQRRADRGSGPDPSAAAPSIVNQALSSPSQPLEATTRSFMEMQFGRNFGQVRVHHDSRAAASANAVNATAYTLGSHIVFGAGMYSPQSADGRRLLAHELTHVLQQGASSSVDHTHASPTLQRDTGDKQEAPAPAPVSETGSAVPKAVAPTDAFAEWWKKIIKFEGTLDDWLKQGANKYDKGGETNMGITRGTFAQFHNAAGLPNTDEAFAAMTPAQAMGIGRSIWKMSRADKINNPGIAIIIADWYWGSTIYAFARVKKVLAGMGYVVDMSKVNTTYDYLDSLTIGLINSLPPAGLIEAFSDERQQHFTDIIKGDKEGKQQKFEKGWRDRAEERRTQAEAFKDVPIKRDERAMLYQSFMRNLSEGKMAEAVKQLNFFNEADIERFIKPLGMAKIAEIHQTARTTDGVGAESNVGRITRYRFRVYSAETAVKSGDWQTAALFLNGFSLEDIKFYLKKWKLKAAQIAELHKGAVEHPEVGPDSRLAQFTKPSGN